MPKNAQKEKTNSSMIKDNKKEKGKLKQQESKDNIKKSNKRQQEMKEIIESEKTKQKKTEKVELQQETTSENKSNDKAKQGKINKKQNKTEKEKQNNKKEVNDKKEKDNKLTKLSNQQMQPIEEVGKEIKSVKRLPEEQLNQIHTRVFQNVFLAVIVILYLNFIILGFKNIENSVFVVDLKVFSMSILVIAIGVIEYAYKKDSGRYAIHGIETLILAIVTMGFIYLNMMWQERFIPVVVATALIIAIYYVAKTIVIYKKMKKQFSLENIKEIIRK